MTFFHEINVWAYIHISTEKSSQKFNKYFIFKNVGVSYEKY